MNQDPIMVKTAIDDRGDRTMRCRLAAYFRSRTGTAAFTLVEVMIAVLVLTMSTLSIGSVYVENMQMATRLRYRTNATNAALNILEQVRVLDYTALSELHAAAGTCSGAAYIRVLIDDPNASDLSSLPVPDPTSTSTPGFGASSVPARYRNLDMDLNVLDGTTKSATWNTFSLPLSSATTAVTMPMRFWLTLNYVTTISGDANITAKGQVYEIVLVYQWKSPTALTSTRWLSGTVRAVVKNPLPQ